jgi:hypothetical protein
MVKYIVFIIPCIAFAQSQLTTGLIETTNGEKIENADVYFKVNSLGTTSNDSGLFALNFNNVAKSDTLVVSHMGYKEYKCKVGDFLKNEKKHIQLIEHTFELDEIILSNAKPSEILTEAIENYENNHFTENTTYIGSIKEVLEENDTLTKLACSAIYLKIPKRKSKKVSITPTKNQSKKEHKSKLLNFSLFCIGELDAYLKMENELSYFLNNIKKFDNVYLKEKKYGSYTVYEIVLEKKLTETKKQTISLIIEKESKGILSMKLEADRGIANEDWVTVFEDENKKIEQKPTFSTADFIFRPYQGRWVLREINTILNYTYVIESGNQKQSLENYNSVEILIDGIHEGKTDKKIKPFDLTRNFFNQIDSNPFTNKHLLNSRELQFITE